MTIELTAAIRSQVDGISLSKWNDTAVRAAITSVAYNAVNTIQFSNVSVTLSDFYVEARDTPQLISDEFLVVDW